MASIVGRTALRSSRTLRTPFPASRLRFASSEALPNGKKEAEASGQALRQGARRDPELYVRRTEFMKRRGAKNLTDSAGHHVRHLRRRWLALLYVVFSLPLVANLLILELRST